MSLMGSVELQIGAAGARALRRPGRLADHLLGRPVAEVAETLPRLFNLCRAAQAQAVHLALGLPGGFTAGVTAEVIRDHRAKVFVTLRTALGLPPMPPRPFAPLPDDPAGLPAWMEGAGPEAELARTLAALFPPGRAVVRAMDFPSGDQTFEPLPFENSAAGRQALHPVLKAVEAHTGRGPLWRYLGLLADAGAASAGRLPPPVARPGRAVVQAARGAYGLQIASEGGLVTAIRRVTPTDQQLVPGGAIDQALAALPVEAARLAPIVMALHDPCIPLILHGDADA